MNWEKWLPVLIVIGATVIGGFVLLAIAAALFSFFMNNFAVLVVVAGLTLVAFAGAAYWFVQHD